MAEQSYEARIEAAALARAAAEYRRDQAYPGSREWENENAKVEEWEATLRDLRRAQAS